MNAKPIQDSGERSGISSDGPKLYPNPAASDHGHERWDVFIYPRTFLHIFQISWHCGACWWWQVHLTLAEKFKSRPDFPRTQGSSCCVLSVGGRLRLLLLCIQLSGRLVYSGTPGRYTPLSAPQKVQIVSFGKECATYILYFFALPPYLQSAAPLPFIPEGPKLNVESF